MEEIINRLRMLKREEMGDRAFYEAVLTALNDIDYTSFTPEAHKLLRTVMEEIGVEDYKTYCARKGIVDSSTVGEGIKQGSLTFATSLTTQVLNKNFKTALFGLGKGQDGWIEMWLENSKKLREQDELRDSLVPDGYDPHIYGTITPKSQVPYYIVAKQALMNWNGLSEEQANETIAKSSFDEVEGQVYAKSSINYALEKINEIFYLQGRDVDQLKSAIFEGKYTGILYAFKPEAERLELNPNEVIMDTLFAVHDGWVKDNGKKFLAREKKHQHMPSELIGWKEAKADLLFVRPIFEAMGIEVDEKALEETYNKRVKNYFLNKNIRTKEDLAREIAKGAEFYPPLEGQEANLEFLSNPDNVINVVIPQIEEKGIGNIEETRKNILDKIKEEPKEEDLERLSSDETYSIEVALDTDIHNEETRISSAMMHNEIKKRIMMKAQKRASLKRTLEEPTKKSDDMVQE